MSNAQEKFFELEKKYQSKEISRMEFFTKAENLVKNAVNRADLFRLLEQAKAKHK